MTERVPNPITDDLLEGLRRANNLLVAEAQFGGAEQPATLEITARLIDRIDSLRSQLTAAEAERDDLVNRPPEHPWEGSKDGHNCRLCYPDSIWKCDEPKHHAYEPPRWDADRLVIEQGWNTPDRCGRCGEVNTALAAAEARITEAESALAVLGRIAQYDPRWVGLAVNDAPSRQQIIAMAYDATLPTDSTKGTRNE